MKLVLAQYEMNEKVRLSSDWRTVEILKYMLLTRFKTIQGGNISIISSSDHRQSRTNTTEHRTNREES